MWLINGGIHWNTFLIKCTFWLNRKLCNMVTNSMYLCKIHFFLCKTSRNIVNNLAYHSIDVLLRYQYFSCQHCIYFYLIYFISMYSYTVILFHYKYLKPGSNVTQFYYQTQCHWIKFDVSKTHVAQCLNQLSRQVINKFHELVEPESC